MSLTGKKIVIAGGSGLIGSALSDYFIKNGNSVKILSRREPFKKPQLESIYWDGFTFDKWINSLEGTDYLINFTGENLNIRWTKANKKSIIESRTSSVIALGEALKKTHNPPKKWLQASAIGYYGNTGSNEKEEASLSGEGFLAEVCNKWESTFGNYFFNNIDSKIIRIGNLLIKNGGMLKPLTLLTKFFMGGKAGNGKQYISWIHIDDLIAIFEYLLENEIPQKVFNAVSPQPVTNQDFMKTLRKVYSRTWAPPAPAFAVKLVSAIIGAPGSLILDSSKVVPKNLLDSDFKFKFTELTQALISLK